MSDWAEDRVERFEAGCSDLKEVLLEIADDRRTRGSINTRILGWFLDRHKDAVVDDLTLKRSNLKTGNRVHYCIEKVSC